MPDGLGATARSFFTALAANNTREFWRAERRVHDHVLRPAFVALLDGLGGTWRVYRPHNDVRFGRAVPYKTFLGAVTERPGGVGAFVRLDADGLLVGTGMPVLARDQLARWRAAIAGPAGVDLPLAAARVEALGARVHSGRHPPLTRVPRGLPAEHDRASWLRWKGVEVTSRDRDPDWLDTPDAVDGVQALLERGGPVHGWLTAHVGESDLTPAERYARRR